MAHCDVKVNALRIDPRLGTGRTLKEDLAGSSESTLAQ